MTGNSTCTITTSDRLLFEALVICRIVDRNQAREITGRKEVSVSTSNARLVKLVRSGFLRRLFIATEQGGVKALYSLTRRSAALIHTPYRPIQRKADSVLISDQFVQHQLALNSVFIQSKFRRLPQNTEFMRWIKFTEPLSEAAPLIPDGYFELETPMGVQPMFCEVDRGTEAQSIWAKKTQLYLKLASTGEFERLLQQKRFRVLVIAGSERRLLQLRKTVAGQTTKVFWFSTLNAINRDGLVAAHWLRPVGDDRLSLL